MLFPLLDSPPPSSSAVLLIKLLAWSIGLLLNVMLH